ncbi:homoserine kinase [Haematospirillum jordaniae]|uniref:homoserine kinase n=1 Tax=Haematospirillum jordaniae TaxID=1549855 RepID=UPI00143282DE|nr:homoserine kinase [Haematospirillum jordaniae]NKD85837.1 homoserine kinase [Haematospirillum jordaniae]
MAVYTKVSDSELAAFVRSYDIGDVQSLEGIAEGVENTNFRLVTSGGTFILTLYEKRVDPGCLPFFLGLMRHLAARGVPCPVPVDNRHGQALGMLCGRPAALVTFLQGHWPRRVLPVHMEPLGMALATMHCGAADFTMTRPNDLSLQGWHTLYRACSDRAHEVEPGLADELAAELAVLDDAWPSGLPSGIIHADLFPDNVFFQDGHLSGLIDFYFACNDMLAYDVAVCLNAWCFDERAGFSAERARLFLSGYHSVRPLQPAELDSLPLLARGAALRFLLTRLYDWLYTDPDALVTKKDPLEYLRRLRFHRTAAGISAYGLTPGELV